MLTLLVKQAALLDPEQIFIYSPLDLFLNAFVHKVGSQVFILKLFELFFAHGQIKIMVQYFVLELLLPSVLKLFESFLRDTETWFHTSLLPVYLLLLLMAKLAHLRVILVVDSVSRLEPLNEKVSLAVSSETHSHFLLLQHLFGGLAQTVLTLAAHSLMHRDQVTPLVQHACIVARPCLNFVLTGVLHLGHYRHRC